MRAEVIHTGAVNGQGVRYCMPPTEGPDLPWVVFDDLAKAAGFPRNSRRRKAAITARHWPTESKRARVNGVDELIVNREVAKVFMFGLLEQQFTTQEVLNDCAQAEAGAAELMFKRLDLPQEEQIRWHFQAMAGGVPDFELDGDTITVNLSDMERLTGIPAATLSAGLSREHVAPGLRLVARKDWL